MKEFCRRSERAAGQRTERFTSARLLPITLVGGGQFSGALMCGPRGAGCICPQISTLGYRKGWHHADR